MATPKILTDGVVGMWIGEDFDGGRQGFIVGREGRLLLWREHHEGIKGEAFDYFVQMIEPEDLAGWAFFETREDMDRRAGERS